MSYRSRLKTLLVAAAIAIAAPMGAGWAQEPMSGGTLHLAAPYGAALKSLDPHVTYNSQDLVVSKAFHRALYTWDSAKNAPALDLAELVSTSEDGKTYTYRLFDNIYFHNGRKLTSDDVIWSYTRIMDPTKGYPGSVQVSTLAGAKEYADGKAKEISGLKKIDDRTFSMTFNEFVDPGMLFFEAITAILPREEVESGNFLTHPVGLGPFSFVEHVEGSRISGKKFDKYYKQGKPYADAVDFTISGDYSALDMAFRAGELDATVLSENAYVLYKADPELSKGLVEVSELFTRHMGFNTEKPPFNDVRVRQAINYAVDRDLIIKKLLKDKAYKATGWLPATSPAFDKDRQPYAYDPAKAKALLAEAGYPDGFSATLKLPPPPYARLGGEIIASELREVGINLEIIPMEWAQWLEQVFTNKEYDLTIVSHTEPNDINIYARDDYYFSYRNPRFNEIMTELDATVEPEKRKELYGQAQRIIAEDAVNVFLFQLPKIGVWDAKLEGMWENMPIQANDLTKVRWLD